MNTDSSDDEWVSWDWGAFQGDLQLRKKVKQMLKPNEAELVSNSMIKSKVWHLSGKIGLFADPSATQSQCYETAMNKKLV